MSLLLPSPTTCERALEPTFATPADNGDAWLRDLLDAAIGQPADASQATDPGRVPGDEADSGPGVDSAIAELADDFERHLRELSIDPPAAAVPFREPLAWPTRGWGFAAESAWRFLPPEVRELIVGAMGRGMMYISVAADGTVTEFRRSAEPDPPAIDPAAWLAEAFARIELDSPEPDAGVDDDMDDVDGLNADRGRNAAYIPDAREIAAGAAIVRAEWTPEQRLKADLRARTGRGRRWPRRGTFTGMTCRSQTEAE